MLEEDQQPTQKLFLSDLLDSTILRRSSPSFSEQQQQTGKARCS